MSKSEMIQQDIGPSADSSSVNLLTWLRRFIWVGMVFKFWLWMVILEKLFILKLLRLVTGQSKRGPVTGPKALRRSFEILGPTFVKLGQLIASGEGLFPQSYSEEFRKCLDQVPPFRTSQVKEIIQQDFGRSTDELFGTFDEKPVAAASIAQVHFATLKDGTEVVAKIQRPGIGEIMGADIAIMGSYARWLSAISREARGANLVGVVEDLAATLQEELDFRREAKNMDEFNEIMQFAKNTDVVAPKVHWDFTRNHVLVMDRFYGTRVDDAETLKAGPYDAEERLLTGIRGWFQCMMFRGFFHGDVHAGNFMVLDDGRVGFLDFGIIGRFSEDQKRMTTEYVLAFQSSNFERLGKVLVDMGSVGDNKIDLKQFAKELGETYQPMYEARPGFKMKDIVPNMMRLGKKYQMHMPREFVLVTKQLVYLQRYVKALGGEKMNVLTDQRLMGMIMQDLTRLPEAEAKFGNALSI